jgi:hypothetical protein
MSVCCKLGQQLRAGAGGLIVAKQACASCVRSGQCQSSAVVAELAVGPVHA